MLLRLVAVLGMCCTVGCFRYEAMDAPTNSIGTELRVHLVPTPGDSVRRMLGAQTVSVDGRLNSSSENALVLAVSATRGATGQSSGWAGEVVSIPRSDVASVERRVLDRRRTTFASAMAVAGAAVGTAILSMGGKTKGSPGEPGGTTPP